MSVQLIKSLLDVDAKLVVLKSELHTTHVMKASTPNPIEPAVVRRLQKLFAKIGKELKASVRSGDISPSKLGEVSTIFRSQSGAMATILNMAVGSASRTGRQKVIDMLKESGISVGDIPLSDNIKDVLESRIFQATPGIMERIAGDVMGNLSDSYIEGVGIDEAANNLMDKFDSLSQFEAERIARTEINSAQNQAAMQTEQDLGVDYHQWVTAGDDRVRDNEYASHVEMESQIVAVGSPFSNGLMYPGDQGGPIEEWINCRCVMVPFIIPSDQQAPADLPYFYEDDLEDVEPVESPLDDVTDEAPDIVMLSVRKYNEAYGEGGRFESGGGTSEGGGSTGEFGKETSASVINGLVVSNDLEAMSHGGGDVLQNNAELVAEQTGVDKEVVMQMYGRWSDTSGDHSGDAIATQIAAQEQFDLKGDMSYLESEEKYGYAQEIHAEVGDDRKAALQATYENTQQYFEGKGIKEVSVYRGIRFRDPPKEVADMVVGEIRNIEIKTQPLTSFSFDYKFAKGYAVGQETRNSYVVSAKIPVSRILSTGIQGMGTTYESEAVVMSTPGAVEVVRVK